MVCIVFRGGRGCSRRHRLSLPLWCRWGGGGRAEPRRHWLSLPRGRGPSQTPKFLSPGPPSPWLPALPIERRFYRFCTELATPETSPRRVSQRQVEPVPRGVSRGDARGEAPCIKEPWSPPSPEGKGVGGIGAKAKLKAGLAGDRPPLRPRRVPLTFAESATPRQAPIEFSTAAERTGAARVQARECKGRSPLHKIT